jgi:hypothetical protein
VVWKGRFNQHNEAGRRRSPARTLCCDQGICRRETMQQQYVCEHNIMVCLTQENKVKWVVLIPLDRVEIPGDVISSLVAHPALPGVCCLEQDAASTCRPCLILLHHRTNDVCISAHDHSSRICMHHVQQQNTVPTCER